MSALRIQPIAPAALPLALLHEADPDENKVRGYLPNAQCYAALRGEEIVGACVLAPHGDDGLEVMNISVLPAVQGQGVGTRLLAAVIDAGCAQGTRRLCLGTGTFGYQLAFYQRAGFRVVAVERDYFTRHYDAPIFEQGIQHRDRLWLERTLDDTHD